MIATAPPARRWLLIEREGPWPRRALDVFEPREAREVAARASALGARVSLIRRPARHPRTPGPFRWAVADIRPGREGIRWNIAESLAEIVHTPWEVSPGEGAPVALVCCHSKHDVCCALRGRPVASALESLWPGHVWECSHLGGDRFAATAVLLPHGLCYGRLDPDVGAATLAAFELGAVLPENLRGRSAFSRHVQAAQALIRQEGLGSDAIDALHPLHVTPLGDGTTEVVLTNPDIHIRFREREIPLGTPATCHAGKPGNSVEYETLSIS
jgi:hypothetical protein